MKIVWFLLCVLLTLFIWYCSSRGLGDSSSMSGVVYGFICSIMNTLNLDMGDFSEHTLRKLAHFSEFAVLCYFACKAADDFSFGARVSNGYILLYCLLVAVIDEYIQFFSPGRGSMVSDILLDFSGAFSMWFWFRVWQWGKY